MTEHATVNKLATASKETHQTEFKGNSLSAMLEAIDTFVEDEMTRLDTDEEQSNISIAINNTDDGVWNAAVVISYEVANDS